MSEPTRGGICFSARSDAERNTAMKKPMAAIVAILAAISPALAGGPDADDANPAARTLQRTLQQTPNTGGVAPDRTTTASLGDKFDAAIAGMRSAGQSAEQVKTMTRIGDIKVVDVGTSDDASRRAAIDKAAADNRSGIESLQAAVRSNNALSTALKAQSAAPEKVVATRLDTDGSLTIYVDKSADFR
jgi:hypothetical protein